MKTIKLIIVGMVIFFTSAIQAQIDVRVQIGVPPPWGPASYSNRYYYLPDVQVYYDIRSAMFIYQTGVTWIHSSSLPESNKNYDLYKGNKVVLTDYQGEEPYSLFNEHKQKYGIGYHGEQHQNSGDKPKDNNIKTVPSEKENGKELEMEKKE
jgi:hypothetical protein